MNPGKLPRAEEQGGETRPSCPYCGNPSRLVGGAVIYGTRRSDLRDKAFYLCEPCSAYVGCHPDSIRPLGRLANAELRQAKMLAHAAFDPLWRNGKWSRAQAYQWLAQKLGLTKHECHIGMFDLATCHRVVQLCREQRRPV